MQKESLTFEIEYFYLATGMEGIPQTYPLKSISAESRDKAVYEYHKSNGIDFGSFESFMKEAQHIREWGLTIKQIK